MALTEETRHHLYQALERQLGAEEAATLMEHLPPVGWADVATKTDLDHLATVLGLRMDTHGRYFNEIDRRFEQVDRHFEQVDRRFEQVDHRFEQVDRRFDEVDRRFEQVDSQLTAIRTSIDSLHETQSTFLRQLALALFVALVSIVVAAIGLG